MKKLALLLAFAMVALLNAPAFASEFSASGSYRFEAVSDEPVGAGADSDYFDQRLRAKFFWQVNDNVSATLQGDFAEAVWSDSPAEGSDTLHISQAYIDMTQGVFNTKIGYHSAAFGHGLVYSDTFQGISASVDLSPVTISAVYSKDSEGDDADTYKIDDDTAANVDADTYAFNVAYADDMFSGGLVYAISTDDNPTTDEEKVGYSAYATFPMEMATLKAAVALFGGDVASSNDEYTGTQFYAALDVPVTDAFSGTLSFVWADSAGDGEQQLTVVTDDWAFMLVDFQGGLGFNNGNFADTLNIFNIAESDELTTSTTGGDAGVMGLAGDIKWVATEDLTLYGTLAYAEPSDDDNTNLEKVMYAIASADYAWMPAVKLSGGIGYVAPEYSDATDDDPGLELVFQLGISF